MDYGRYNTSSQRRNAKPDSHPELRDQLDNQKSAQASDSKYEPPFEPEWPDAYHRRRKRIQDIKQSYFDNANVAIDEPIPEAEPTRKTVTRKKVVAEKRTKNYLGWIISIAVAIVAAFFIRAFVFEIILVEGNSMYPTLYSNERVAVEKVSRYGGMPEHGDILIVEYPNMPGTYIKRAVGLPGDTLEIKNSIVYLNGVALEEDYINSRDKYVDMAETVVPLNHVFVMGDNRAHSMDSRTDFIGPISHDAIVGHVVSVIWPFDAIRSVD